MINTNRIVPVMATDLISLYGLILNVGGENVTAVNAVDVLGDFEVTSASGKLLASEPVKSLDIDADITSATIYFVPTSDYVGFTVGGVTATIADGSDEVEADGATLYKAVLATGEITITKVGF